MRGVGLVEFGGPEVLTVVDLPDVHAGQGEVRIRVHAATVNPTDTGIRDGSRAEALKDVPTPYVPGMDAAGVVDEIGLNTVTDLQVGDRVMAMVIPLGSHGAYRESLVLAADSVVRAVNRYSPSAKSTTTVWPSLNSPARMRFASSFSIRRWMTRRSGRAPYAGS